MDVSQGDHLITFSERVDAVYRHDQRSGVPKDADAYKTWMLARGVGRARGALVQDKLAELDGHLFVYEPSNPPSTPDDEMQLLILRTLRRIKRLDPSHLGHVPLDAAGVCLIEGVSKSGFDYSDQRLRDRGWVDAFGMGWDDHNHNEKITELGLQELEGIEARMSAKTEDEIIEMNIPAESAEYFVAHEFSPDQIDDLRRAIGEALESSGLQGYYADAELRQGHIFRDKILPKITETVFGIYDVSNPAKPNVFLELGAGLALDKICVIICKRGTLVPADLGGLDRIEYQSYKDLTSQLKEKLLAYLPPASTGRKLIIQIPRSGAPPN